MNPVVIFFPLISATFLHATEQEAPSLILDAAFHQVQRFFFFFIPGLPRAAFAVGLGRGGRGRGGYRGGPRGAPRNRR